MGWVFAINPGDLGSIPGRVIPKTLKIVLDTSLLNTQQYKVCIKGKVEQSRKRSSGLPYGHQLYLLHNVLKHPLLILNDVYIIFECLYTQY